MTKHLFSHLKQNTIAYFALFIALGGTSYASVSIPQHLNAQRTASSAKATITCGGRCPARTVYWAYIGAQGCPQVFVASAPNVCQSPLGGVPAQLVHQGLGDWLVFFQQQPLQNCARFGNLTHARGSATVAGWDSKNTDPQAIHVLTTNAAGQAADLDFVVGALCGGGSGNIQFGASPPASGTAAGEQAAG